MAKKQSPDLLEKDTQERYPRRTNRRNKTRKQIVLAARRLFSKQGYKNTTMANIADEADVHVTTVFNHFENKMELLLEITALMFEEHVAEFPREESFLECYPQRLKERNKLWQDANDRTFEENWLADDPEVFAAWINFEARMARFICACIAEDYAIDTEHDPRPFQLANLIVTTTVSNYLEWRESGNQTDLTRENQLAMATIKELIGDSLSRKYKPPRGASGKSISLRSGG